jgi:hypothetical protein
VTMRNVTREPLASVPISIDVRGAGNSSLFRNDEPGLEPTLVGTPLLRPGQRFTWVNDQVNAADRPRTVRAKVGNPRGKSPARIPAVTLSSPKLEQDPVSGISAVGSVRNKSKVEQRKLVIFGVAWRGKRVVAAGRAQVNRLKPGKHARYTIFFIGNPRGARLTVTAPPTTLG